MGMLYQEFITPMDGLSDDAQYKLGKILEIDPGEMGLIEYAKEVNSTLDEIFDVSTVEGKKPGIPFSQIWDFLIRYPNFPESQIG